MKYPPLKTRIQLARTWDFARRGEVSFIVRAIRFTNIFTVLLYFHVCIAVSLSLSFSLFLSLFTATTRERRTSASIIKARIFIGICATTVGVSCSKVIRARFTYCGRLFSRGRRIGRALVGRAKRWSLNVLWNGRILLDGTDYGNLFRAVSNGVKVGKTRASF